MDAQPVALGARPGTGSSQPVVRALASVIVLSTSRGIRGTGDPAIAVGDGAGADPAEHSSQFAPIDAVG
jgi:hypothetical protein